MGIYEFIALDKESKANAVWGGKFLADKTEDYYIEIEQIYVKGVKVNVNNPELITRLKDFAERYKELHH